MEQVGLEPTSSRLGTGCLANRLLPLLERRRRIIVRWEGNLRYNIIIARLLTFAAETRNFPRFGVLSALNPRLL